MTILRSLLCAVVLFLAACSAVPVISGPQSELIQIQVPSIERLSDRDITTVKGMLAKLEPFIAARKKVGDQVLLTFEELYQQLDPEETSIVQFVQHLKPEQIGVHTPFVGYGDPATRMVSLNETYKGPGGATIVIPTQYLPEVVYRHYQAMMAAMQADLGKRLYVESGYRSGAYQLYLYFLYLQNHDWSIRKTGRLVALPGYSEHGARHRQAVDFVSENSALDDESEKFEQRAEYEWLQKNAHRFGFVLSYPRGSVTGITFEPWHWHFELSTQISH